MKYKIYFFLFILLWCYQATAKTCLTESTDIKNLTFQREPNTGQIVHVWIVADDAPTYDCFRKRTTIRKRLPMRNRYRVVKNNYRIRSDGKYWSLLVNSDQKVSSKTISGWISHDNIIVTNEPLKSLETGIFQKILIKEGDCNNGKALQVYNDRELTTSKEAIEVRTVFYVYDFFPRNARTPENDDVLSLLIGAYPTLNTASTNAPLLIGWIKKKECDKDQNNKEMCRNKVTFWNSRTACEFHLNTNYELYDNNRVIYKPEIMNKPLRYNELRNPILQDLDQYYRIGTFSKLDDFQLGIRKKIEKIKTGIEVLFVIDGTRSMTHVFKATIEAIKEVSYHLIETSKSVGLETPRFALLFYRDDPTGVSYKRVGRQNIEVNYEYCTEEFSSFPMGNHNNLLYQLNNHIACDSDNTIKESMYLGLVKGVVGCNFDTGVDGEPKRLRTIIHLGDAGDNGRGDLTSKHVSDILNKYRIFRYISVNVSGVETSDFNKSIVGITLDNRIGETDHYNKLKGIAPLIANKLKKFVEENATNLHDQIQILAKGFAIKTENVKKFESNPIKIINNKRYNKYAKSGIAGTTEGRIGVVSDAILNYAKKVIHANNIKLNQYNAFQQYVEGNLPKHKPLKKYILVSKTNIEEITYSLTAMIEASGSIKKKKKVWDISLKVILGDQTCTDNNGFEMSLEDCNKQRSGIPIKAGFMKFTKKQFINLSGRQLKKVICQAKIAREQFRAFLDDKYLKSVNIHSFDPCSYECNFEDDINGDDKVVHEEINENDLIDKYFFNEGSGLMPEQMAWIPIEHFSFNEENHEN